mmetsp:Transcript_46748/g.74786  ORF Transcript_46748/g.74786 Transcript_46748/m.74786 type:complete len:203 (-) Transcript_46748:688-1296(-)
MVVRLTVTLHVTALTVFAAERLSGPLVVFVAIFIRVRIASTKVCKGPSLPDKPIQSTGRYGCSTTSADNIFHPLMISLPSSGWRMELSSCADTGCHRSSLRVGDASTATVMGSWCSSRGKVRKLMGAKKVPVTSIMYVAVLVSRSVQRYLRAVGMSMERALGNNSFGFHTYWHLPSSMSSPLALQPAHMFSSLQCMTMLTTA